MKVRKAKPAILFVGSFLSKKSGTTGIAEKMRPFLSDDFELFYASDLTNKVGRLADIIYQAIFSSYDTVHCDVFSGQSFWVADVVRRIAMLRNKKVILNLQGGRLTEFLGETWLRQRTFRMWATSGAHLVSPSSFLATTVQKQWDLTVGVFPNFIDINRFPFSNRARTGRRLLWVRAFKNIYQPEIALYALAQLHAKYEDTTLTMVGPDKGTLDSIMALAKKLGIEDRLDIKGPIPNDKLYEQYHSHDIFLNTTAYESFGMAVFEAAACGIPIVSTKVGELPYIWEDRVNIMFAIEQNGDAFAEAIETFLKNNDLSNQLQQTARHKAEQYVWENLKPRWVQLFESI